MLEPVKNLTDFKSRIERINEDYFEGKDLLKDFKEEKNLDKQSEYLVFFFADNRKGNYINKLRRITEKLASQFSAHLVERKSQNLLTRLSRKKNTKSPGTAS